MKVKVTENSNSIPASQIVRVFVDIEEALNYIALVYPLNVNDDTIINIEFLKDE